MIEIRQAEAADTAAIRIFIEKAYGPLTPFKGPDRWNWQFVENPFRPAQSGVPVWIACDGSTIVGQIAVQWGEAKTPAGAIPIGWIVDVMVLPEYRGRSLGHDLYRAVASEVPVLLTLTMAPATRRMAERLGAITLGPVWQMARLVAPTPSQVNEYVLTRTQHHRRLHAATLLAARAWIPAAGGAVAARAATALYCAPKVRYRNKRRMMIEPVNRFGSEMDGLWDRIGGQSTFAASRTSKFMNWRFADCPELKYERFLATKEGMPTGCMVLREATESELRVGIIAELLASPDDGSTIDSLVTFAMRRFGTKIAAIECGTSSAAYSKHLTRYGFLRTRTHRPTIVCHERFRKIFSDHPQKWLFSKADHDWDQVHLSWSAAHAVKPFGRPPTDMPSRAIECS